MTAYSFAYDDKKIDYAIAALFIAMGLSTIYIAIAVEQTITRLQVISTLPINSMVGLSFILRRAPSSPTISDEILVPAFSFLMPTVIMNSPLLPLPKFSYEVGLWIAVPGILLSLASLFCLRHCFAVLPSVRGTVGSGPYRLVRHPLYLGETFIVLGMMLLSYNPASIVLFLASFPLLALRIGMEERKLMASTEYRDYAEKVRYRLVPFIY